MNSSRRDFLLRSGLVSLGGSGLLVSACGGGGGGTTSFPSSGTRSFEGSVQPGFSLVDPQTGCTITVPTGAMIVSSKVQLTVWTGQRNLAARTGFDISDRAFDITINPSELIGHRSIEVKLPWKQGGDLITTAVVAYGPNGRSLVLRDAPNSKPDFPIALLGSQELKYLVESSTSINSPAVIQVAVAEQNASRSITSSSDNQTLTEIWSRPKSRTSYATRQRVAIVTHGILDNAAGQAPVVNFLQGKFPMDGDPGTNFPFDKVTTHEYTWSNDIQSNGAEFAAKINTAYGDPSKYEVFVFAHSMGGLVSRVAIEKAGTPSVKQLVTLGTPHLGVPLTVLKNVAWLNLGLSLRAPGVKQLLEDSDVIRSLNGSRANNVDYKVVAGTSYSSFKGALGDAIDVIYTILNLKRIEHDGIVPKTSAFGGPAVSTSTVSLNHSQLVDQISSYWTTSAGSWVSGLNRKIKEIVLTPSDATVTEGQSITLNVRLLDKDSDVLDQTLNPDLKFEWTVVDQSIATVANGVVSGKKAGTVLVTLKELQSGVSTSKTVVVTSSSQSSPPLTIADYKRQMRDINGQFKMGRTEVTVAMWKEYCAVTGKPMPPAPAWGWIDSHPIVNVSWYDIMGNDGKGGYCAWASSVSGVSLTLPSVEHWEYVATGGDYRVFPWGGYGKSNDGGITFPGWDSSKCINSVSNIRKSTAPVGSIPAGNSPFGCSDMAGNVWEWCKDSSDIRPINKFLKGGSWVNSEQFAFWCAGITDDFPGTRDTLSGFRLAEGPV